jgi:hypothetical protein
MRSTREDRGSMADPPPSFTSLDPRLLPTVEVVERPAAERPAHDSLDAIAEWLVGPARRIASGIRAFDEFAWRMLAAGLPLLRVTLKQDRDFGGELSGRVHGHALTLGFGQHGAAPCISISQR